MFPDDKNKIEDLKKTLYSRQNFKPDSPVHDLPNKTYEVKDTWTPPIDTIKKTKWPLGKILVWFSFIFFFVAVCIAGFIYYNGYNTISADNVDIAVTGSPTIDAGRDSTFAVSIDNKNQVDLQDAYLNIEYPDGARKDASQTEPLVQDHISLGNLATGGHLDRTFNAAFFGLEGTQEKIKISVEYHVLGSTNLFARNKDYLFTLGASPVSVVVSHVAEVNSGQDVSFAVTVTSNSTEVLNNLALNAQYPFGFTFKNAVPSASLDNNVWQIGDLAPGENKTIMVSGKIEGQENEDRAFKFNVGINNPIDTHKIATVFYADTETVKIQKPFIGLDLTFDNNNSNPYPVRAGDIVNATLSYSNNMSTSISDAVIVVKFDGVILDKNNIFSTQGFYQSADNTITWDKRNLPALGFLSPGDKGTVQFSFKTLPYSVGASYSKSSQKINLSTNVNATQVGSSGNISISSGISRSVVVASNIALMANAVYSSGSLNNTGPIPPKVEQNTTYTINWSISNTFNNISNVVVSAVLPSYVKFLNNVSPQNEALTYDPISGEVDWNVGNIKTNTGFTSAPRQVSFQVSILPSLSQVGTIPILMGDSTLKANDTYTNSALTSSADSVTTDIIDDPQFKSGWGVVNR